MSAPIVDIRGVWTAFGGRVIHQGIDFSLNQGETVGLVGGSGTGKTTLLRAVIGLERPARGEIRVFGEPLFDRAHRDLRSIHRRIGILFQHGALFSALSVFDNVAFPLRELGELDESLIRDLVHLKLQMVELEPKDGRLTPAQLSGGMVKRVALARALALEPELLVLDEPTAGLDPDRSAGFVRLIKLLQGELRFSVLMVTHDLDTLLALASRVAFLADGRIAYDGPLAGVAGSNSPQVREYFAGVNIPAGGA
jgi:phospholipid/cholesterol/gamma-HCH transport system ATP-binding protein